MIDKLQKTFSPEDTLYAKDMNLVTGKIDEIVESVNTGSGVGKVDPGSDGTGEIFNDYANNKATGKYSHAGGYMCKSSGDFSFSYGDLLISSAYGSVAFSGSTTNIYLDGEAGTTKYEYGKTTGWLKDSLTKKELVNYFKHSDIKLVDYGKDTSFVDWEILDHKIVDVIYEEEGDKVFLVLDKTLSSTEALVNKKYGILRNISSGKYSFIEGYSNFNSSFTGHVEGSDNTLVKTQSSHVEGCLNYASGRSNDDCIHVEGFCNTAQNLREHAQGQYNKSNTGSTEDLKTIHSIGVGTKTKRMNAQEVMRNGDHYVLGIGGYDGTNPESAQTLQEVIKGITDGMGEINSLLDQINGEVV